MARRQRLASAFTVLILTAAAQAGDFIRVDEDESAARLQTAVTRFEKDGAAVELIGAVHIADKKYYQTLSTRFEGYDAVLFEMIGGEKFAAAKQAVPDETELSGRTRRRPACGEKPLRAPSGLRHGREIPQPDRAE